MVAVKVWLRSFSSEGYLTSTTLSLQPSEILSEILRCAQFAQVADD